jgi:thiamine biosynthesis protein ThiS
MNDNVIVNGEPRRWHPGLRIDDLLDELLPAAPDRDSGTEGASKQHCAGVAVAVNELVVPRGRWSQQVIAGDRIEIVTAVQGG